MAKEASALVAPYHVTELTVEDGMDIAMWRTPGPWAVQDSLEPPRPDEGFWSVRDATDHLMGYCCFGEKARPLGLDYAPGKLDVALGMDPQLSGQHLSRDFAAAVVSHAREVADSRRLRCAVPLWNAVGRRTAEAAGFQLVGSHEVKGGRTLMTFFVYEM